MSDPFAERGFRGLPIDCCPVIDAHGHLGECPSIALVDSAVEPLLRSMDRLGVNMTAISAVPALLGDAARGNRLVEAAVRAHPDRFFGYMAADAGYPERIQPELERGLAGGCRGVKVWSYGDRPGLPYDHVHYLPIFEFAQAHRLPVLAHTWGAELDQLEPAILRYPDITWLLAHTGSVDLWKYLRLGKTYPNVYLELCFSPSPRGLVEELVGEGLAEKLVWGSDAVFISAAQQLGRVLFAQISVGDKARILGGNAMRALRIG